MKIKINKNKFIELVNESVNKHLLKEGTTFSDSMKKWDYLKQTVGAEQMLDCIFDWCSSDQIDTFIKWFEEEDYLEGGEMDECGATPPLR